jgi:hypothetical protein
MVGQQAPSGDPHKINQEYASVISSHHPQNLHFNPWSQILVKGIPGFMATLTIPTPLILFANSEV